MTDEQELKLLSAKISEGRVAVRAATVAAREQAEITELEAMRRKLLDRIKRARLEELGSRCPDLPGTWTWSAVGHAVDDDGAEVYIDGGYEVCFEDGNGDSEYRHVDVVRAVIAAYDAEKADPSTPSVSAETRAFAVADAIISDLSDRHGLGNFWHEFDEGLQAGIRDIWATLVLEGIDPS